MSFRVSGLAMIDIKGATAETYCPSELREDTALSSSTIVFSSKISCSTAESAISDDGFRMLCLLRLIRFQSIDWCRDEDEDVRKERKELEEERDDSTGLLYCRS